MTVWNEAVPSGTSPVGQFPAYAHAIFATIGASLGIENLFLGSGGVSDASHVAPAQGGSRAYFDVQSNSSTPTSQATGRLFLASDVSRLFAYFSGGTYLVGTAFGSEYSSDAGTGYWATQSGSYTTTDNGASNTTIVTFPQPFLAQPVFISQTLGTAVGASAVVNLDLSNTNLSKATFQSNYSVVGNPGAFTVFWEALGQMSSVSY